MSQRVVAIVKPHVAIDFPGQMGNIALEAIGRYCDLELKIIGCRKIQFTEALAKEFYAEHERKSFFSLLVSASIMGPCIVLLIEGVDTIEKVRNIHGPTDPPDGNINQLRRNYGRLERKRPYNAFHCTATPEEFLREYEIAFKKCLIVPWNRALIPANHQ